MIKKWLNNRFNEIDSKSANLKVINQDKATASEESCCLPTKEQLNSDVNEDSPLY